MGKSKKAFFPKNPLEIFLFVLLCLFYTWILIWILRHTFLFHPHVPPHLVCIDHLRQIDAAANQFALEHSLTNGEAIHFPNDLTTYIKLNSKWEIEPCPAGGHYSISRVGEAPTCSLGTTVTPSHVLP